MNGLARMVGASKRRIVTALGGKGGSFSRRGGNVGDRV